MATGTIETSTLTPAAAKATADERAAAGRAARKARPRSAHGEWEPAAGRPDPVAVLEAQAETRVAELVPIRYGRMLVSPFAFFRGGAAIMAADLAPTPATGLRVQLCGDAHLSNFGAFAAPDRDLLFDLNDFDETLPGAWEWDVKRLGASFEIAARERGFGRKLRGSLVQATARGYREAMRGFAAMRHLDVWYQRLDISKLYAQAQAALRKRQRKGVEREIAKARRKTSLRAFEKLTERDGEDVRIASDPPLIVPVEEVFSVEGADAERWLGELLADYAATLPDDTARLFGAYDYVHSARKVVGVGSVGTRVWIVLFLGRDGSDPLFLQVKEAQRSVLEPYAGNSEYEQPGERVVKGQRLMQAAGDIFLGWFSRTDLDGVRRHFYVRQLWDQKGSVEVEGMEPEGMERYALACGWTLARAHARSGDRIGIAAYLGGGDGFDRALARFATTYADQNERDFASLAQAVERGELHAETGV